MVEPELNPYQSPTAPLMTQGGGGDERPAYKLYSAGAITLATFLGSLLAGGVLMAINYKRLERGAAAVHAVVWTIFAMVGLIGLALMLPESLHIPNAAFFIPQIIAMHYLSTQLQGPSIERHQRSGGQMASWWLAVGIALAVSAVLVVAIIAMAVAAAMLSPGA
jgi:hypothetical protein